MSHKIVILTNSLLKGGAEKQIMLLCNILIQYYKVILIVLNSEEKQFNIDSLFNESNIKIILLSGNKFVKYKMVYKIIKEHSPKLIFSYLLQTNLLNGIIGKILDIPFRIGGIRSSYLTQWKFYIQRFIHNNLNSYTIFNNYKGLDLLCEKGFNRKKSVVIPNCIECTNNLIMRSNKDYLTILTVARFDVSKDHLTSLKSFSQLLNDNINVKYTIVGYGKQEEIIVEEIAKLNLQRYVTICKYPANIEELYKEADVYLQLSHFEGLSNSIMEAMCFSLPIIATAVGDNNRLVNENVNGFLVKVGEIEKTVKKLHILINNHAMRLKFGKRSYEMITEHYSVEKFKVRYFKFISELST